MPPAVEVTKIISPRGRQFWELAFMSSNWKSIGAERARQHPLYGIRGWLLVFLVGNFIGLLWMWAPVNSVAMDHKISIGQLLSIDAPEIAFLKATLYMQVALGVATIFLIFTKYQHFRLITISGRLAIWPILGVVALSQGISETGNSLAYLFFQWVVSCAVWVTYLQRSKRVRVTFEHCVRNDEHQIAPEAVPNSSSYTNQTNATMPPSAQPPVAPINDSPLARQESERHPVDSPARKAVPRAQDANHTFNPIAMNTESSIEEDRWATAMAEVDSDQRRPGVWAKAFAESEGDETKAKVAYLKVRVQQLTHAANAELAKYEAHKQEQVAMEQAALLEKHNAIERAISCFLSSGTISTDQIRLLLQQADLSHLITLKDSIKGNTLLHICAESDMAEEVQALLIAGADKELPNNAGVRPEYITKSEVIRWLIREGSLSRNKLRQLQELGITIDRNAFCYLEFRYDRLEDAIAYAENQRGV